MQVVLSQHPAQRGVLQHMLVVLYHYPAQRGVMQHMRQWQASSEMLARQTHVEGQMMLQATQQVWSA